MVIASLHPVQNNGQMGQLTHIYVHRIRGEGRPGRWAAAFPAGAAAAPDAADASGLRRSATNACGIILVEAVLPVVLLRVKVI